MFEGQESGHNSILQQFENTGILSNKNISGKKAEQVLGHADITANKNMVPFDDKSPFITSGIRFGTPAITTRGLKENDMAIIVDFIDEVLTNAENDEVLEKVKKKVNALMSGRDLFYAC